MAKLLIVSILVIISIANTQDQSTSAAVSSTPYTMQRSADDISCHYITDGDALPSAEDASFSPPTDSIFFHETSCRGVLNSRGACSIESAAKAHPGRKIYVLFSGPISKKVLYFTRSSLFELKSYYPNIYFMRVHVDEYAKNTAIEKIVTQRIHNTSRWKFSHTSDLLRFLTMYKFGGLYLDTDMIVLKPLDDLGRNWVARESGTQVACGAVHAAKDVLGKAFIWRVLEEVGSSYMPFIWNYNGPGAMNRVLSKFCNTTKVEEFSKATCRGFEVYHPELIYPVHYDNYKKLLEPGDLLDGDKAFTIHIWNSRSYATEVQWNSPFDKLAKQYCPMIRKLYGNNFGC